MIIPLIILGLVYILIATICDFKTNEIPNWLNFSLLVFALGYRAFYSAFNNDFSFFLWGLFGAGFFFLIANLFYYSRLFAGGDTKLLIGLGPVLALANSFYTNIMIFLIFIFLLLLAGSVYGLVYSFILSFKYKERFINEFKSQLRKKSIRIFFKISLILAVVLFILILIISEFFLLVLPLIFLILPFLFVYARAIEEACMINEVSIGRLREGDWLYENLKIGKHKINANWQGLTMEEINMIKKSKIKKVLIKKGIPFVLAFLIAFVIFIWLFFSNSLLFFI